MTVFWGIAILLVVALTALLLIAAIIAAHTLTHPPRRTTAYAIAHNHPTDPSEATQSPAPFTTHTLNAADNTPIELWHVTGSNPAGPTLILIHGYGDSRLGSLLWLPTLLPLASTLILYDLRAHGESKHTRFTWSTPDIDDLARITQHANQQLPAISHHPHRPVILVGFSLGAAIAITAAQQLGPSHVAAVIADSPFRHAATAIRNTIQISGIPPQPITALALTLLRIRSKPALINTDLTHTAAQLTQPLLIMHGNDDTITPPTDAQAIADAAPIAQLHLFDNAEHLGPAADSQRYQTIIRDWLESLPEAPITPIN